MNEQDGRIGLELIKWFHICTVQKMYFFIQDYFSKCDQIRRSFPIWSHLLNKSLMENFIFCVVWSQQQTTGDSLFQHFDSRGNISIFYIKNVNNLLLIHCFFCKNPLYKNRKVQKTLKIKIMLRLVFSHSEFPYYHHIILLIFICTRLQLLKNMKFFLSIFLELILIKIDSLLDAQKDIRKISVSFCYSSSFEMSM